MESQKTEFDENALPCIHSIEAEQSVIGGILLDGQAIARCINLTADKFYLHQHKLIYQAILDVHAAKQPIDVITVSTRLEDMGLDEQAGGLNYVVTIAQNTPSAANVKHYAKLVEEKYILRELFFAAEKIKDISLSKDGLNPSEKISDAVSLISKISKNILNQNTTAMTYAESLAEMVDWMLKVQDLPDGALLGISTGIHELDRKTGGLQNGNLVVIAARPGMGKTVLAENIARHAAKTGKKVHLQSYEMSQRELSLRGASAEMGIDFGNLKRCRLTQSEYDDLTMYLNKARNWNLDVDTEPMNADKLCLMAKDKKMSQGLDLLVIDHLHLMPKPGKAGEVIELGDITGKLKRLAMELDIPVLLLAQLNRLVAKQADKRPTMADIRGSGSIEQDANIIIMPHRPSYYDENENPNLAELIIAKNRDGEMGTVIAGWEGNYQRFTDDVMPWEPKEESRYEYAD